MNFTDDRDGHLTVGKDTKYMSSSSSTRRPRLSEWELTWAFVAGGGIVLIILALGMNAIHGPNLDQNGSSTFGSMLIMGGLLLVGGTACWMIQLRPWRKFDNFSVPLYTGHHEIHADHVEVHEDESHAEAHEPLIPPVLIDPMTAFSSEASEVVNTAPQAPAATSTHPDNFSRIYGIGPKIASALVSAGIFSFAELAQRNPADLEAILHAAKVRLVGSAETWPMQAQFAAKEDWDGLERYHAQHLDRTQ